MWDEIAKQMQGSDMTLRSKMTTVLTSYEEFKARDQELLVSTYNRYCNLLNNLRKNKITKLPMETNIKFLNNLQPEWKRHSMNVIQNRDLSQIDIHTVFEILSLNQDEVLEAQMLHKSTDKQMSDPSVLLAEKCSRSSGSTKQGKSIKIKNQTRILIIKVRVTKMIWITRC